MPKNAYQKLAEAQTGLGRKLGDISHEKIMGDLDIANTATKSATLTSSTEGVAQLSNLIKSQRRIDEQDKEETAEAEKLGYEKVITKKGSLFGETGFIPEVGYKDPESGDVFTGEYLTEQSTLNKELAQQGVDFDKFEGMLDEAKGETAEIKSQFYSFQKVQERVGKDYGDLINVVNDLGNQYRMAGENGEYDMLDFSAIEKNLDELLEQMIPREEKAVAPNVPEMGEDATYEVDSLGEVPTYKVDIMDLLKTSIEDYQDKGMEEYGAYYKSFGLGSPLQYWNQAKGEKK